MHINAYFSCILPASFDSGALRVVLLLFVHAVSNSHGYRRNSRDGLNSMHYGLDVAHICKLIGPGAIKNVGPYNIAIALTFGHVILPGQMKASAISCSLAVPVAEVIWE